MVLELKAKQKNLEFLAPSESCHIVDKEGGEVTLETLQSKDVVGFYFSALHRVATSLLNSCNCTTNARSKGNLSR